MNFKKNILILLTIFTVSFLSAQVKMNQKVRSLPKEISEKVFEDPEENLPALVKNLIGKSTDANSNVKLLHDWICDNIAYDTDMSFHAKYSSQDYVSVIKNKKAICSGYTNLMIAMCEIAGIECIGIEGWSKGFGYTGNVDNEPNHAWNAVKIGKNWKLIDVTWDAGFVNYDTFIKKYTNDWYGLTPEQFLYSHLPQNDEYQFVSEGKRKTKANFVKEPYVAGVFFTYGLDFKGTIPNYTTKISGETKFEITQSKSNVSVHAGLRERESRATVDCATWTEKKGNVSTSFFDVPDKGNYKAFLFARYSGQEFYGDNFPIGQFEGQILPGVENLLSAKKITKAERDYFVNAFFKVEKLGLYYIYDDTLATTRNAAIKKICKLLDLNPNVTEIVLSFNIESDGKYSGFGKGSPKYPDVYLSYVDSSGVELVSPRTGILKAGETYNFAVASTSYTSFGVVIDENLQLMTKNSKTGNFEISVKVPKTDTFTIYATKGGKSAKYSGLFFYKVK